MASSAASREQALRKPASSILDNKAYARHTLKSVDAKLSSIMLDDIHYPTNGRYEIVKSTRLNQADIPPGKWRIAGSNR